MDNYIQGLRLVKDIKKNIPSNLEDYLDRDIFTLEEGGYTAILLYTSSISDSRMKELWQQEHHITVRIHESEFEQTEPFKCMGFIDENHYLVVGKFNWSEILRMGYRDIEIDIIMGFRHIKF